MFLFDNNERKSIKNNSKPRNKSKKLTNTAEAKAAAKAKKIQQDDMEALQITFYEIESWIEKTSPVLSRMTRELDKASRHFDKKKKLTTSSSVAVDNRQSFIQSLPDYSIPSTITNHGTHKSQGDESISSDDLQSMQWTLSFLPGNSMRLETNIKSVEQLIEAVQKIKLITESAETSTSSSSPSTVVVPEFSNDDYYDELEYASTASTISSIVVVDPSIEYWNIAMYRRPHTCLEKYKHCDMNLNRLTEDVSPSVLSNICQIYWDCLHPKFSADWSTFWDRSGDPARNQVCIDSGLAMVFLHIIRHNKNACANAHTIAYYYFDRAREALMDYFDSPDFATIETLLNLSMFCVLCKRHSQSRIYIGLAYSMMHQLNMHQLSTAILPSSRLQRKKYLKLYMVLYYNDIMISVYSGEPALIDDQICNIDFYDILSLNKQLVEYEEANYDDKTIAKESFFVHLLELAKIGKRIQHVTRDYQRQNLQHHHSGTLPLRWVKKVQEIEIALATWFDRLPLMYRVDPKPTRLYPELSTNKKPHDHTMDVLMMREQSALLLMLQYQTQWIHLHKTFLSPNINDFGSPQDSSDIDTSPPSPLGTTPYRTMRSYNICTDAANRIVIMAEVITERFDWCVCQQFISCVYQASTVFCKSIINKDSSQNASKAMIHRITAVLAASKINYQGLPDDLTACLNEFLAENDQKPSEERGGEDAMEILDQLLHQEFSTEQHTVVYNDTMFNSPHRYQECLNQQLTTKPPLSLNREPPSEAMFSIKIQNPSVVPMDLLEPDNKNWRCKFSSSNIAQVDHRVM
ncbi:unnamed protein product [Mucor hiemalis]